MCCIKIRYKEKSNKESEFEANSFAEENRIVNQE